MCLLEEAAFALEKGAVVMSHPVSMRRVKAIGIHLEDGARAAYTERFLSSLIAFISIFLRPILTMLKLRVKQYGRRWNLFSDGDGLGRWPERTRSLWSSCNETR